MLPLLNLQCKVSYIFTKFLFQIETSNNFLYARTENRATHIADKTTWIPARVFPPHPCDNNQFRHQ